MDLSRDQERLLTEGNVGERKAMEILIALGDVYEATDLIPVTSAHVSGASYKTIKDPGLKFLSEISKESKVKIHTTVNPIGMDRVRYREMGVSEDFATKQRIIIDIYKRMGVAESWTCTPFLIGNRPGRGESIAWAESSAVVFANSVLGARTNREGGPSALAAALTGFTPRHGMHIRENRIADVLFEADFRITGKEYALLGYFAGRICGDRVPYFRKIAPSEDDLKTMAASFASSGSGCMFHVEGVTPEWRLGLKDGYEKISLGREELIEIEESWSADDDPDMVTIGCPHASASELEKLAKLLDKGWKGPELWVCTSRYVCMRFPRPVTTIEKYGKVLCDTCVMVSSVKNLASTVATNSGKAATYLPLLCNQEVIFSDIESLVRRFQ